MYVRLITFLGSLRPHHLAEQKLFSEFSSEAESKASGKITMRWQLTKWNSSYVIMSFI